MITEQDKQAILNGAYGVTRHGYKVKFVGKGSHTPRPQFFVFFNDAGLIAGSIELDNNFMHLQHMGGCFDIVGLWEDKPEPFDLERALAGELVKYSDKPCYVYQSNVTGLFWVEAQDGSFVDNDTPFEDVSEQGMWKEPEAEPKTVTLTLPRPLKEPKEGMWFINSVGEVCESGYKCEAGFYDEDCLNAGFYFATKEDAQAWVDAMRNNRI